MKKTVFFTGAGASHPFGFPLTKNLLSLILKNQGPQNLELTLQQIFPGLDSLKEEELPWITDLLSLIDFSIHSSFAPVPMSTQAKLQELRFFLEKGILRTLRSDALAVPDSLSSQLLNRFSNWLLKSAGENPGSIGIISTNYDIAVETELYKKQTGAALESAFDFGFSWRDVKTEAVHQRPEKPLLSLFKLHGSLNWLECPLCEHIYINPKGPVGLLGFSNTVSDGNTCDCGHAPLRSVIVAPSLIRDIRDVNLLEIWKAALELLRASDEWIIAGYSFPSEDIAIRSLFMRAYHGRKIPPEIKVIQHAEDQATRNRYKLLFKDFSYEIYGGKGFAGFIEGL